jgi:hypothetical protein
MYRQRGIEQRRHGSNVRPSRHTLGLSIWGWGLMKVIDECTL